MSIEAPNWYTTQYNTRVSHILQNEGFLLRGTTMPPVEVVGNVLKFFFLGKTEAVPFGPTVEDVKPSNLPKTTKDLTMSGWQVAEYVRHGEPEQIKPEYKGQLQEALGFAMGRKYDRVIMETMDGEAGNITTIGDGSAPISPIDVTTAKAQIGAVGMSRANEYFCPLPTISWEQLKLYKVFNNADYTGPEHMFNNGVEAKTWNNIHFFQAPDDMFTSTGSGHVDTYLWNRRQLGFGSNYDMNMKITYENIKTAWLYNMVMNAGAKVLQTAGVRRLRIKINAALTIN